MSTKEEAQAITKMLQSEMPESLITSLRENWEKEKILEKNFDWVWHSIDVTTEFICKIFEEKIPFNQDAILMANQIMVNNRIDYSYRTTLLTLLQIEQANVRGVYCAALLAIAGYVYLAGYKIVKWEEGNTCTMFYPRLCALECPGCHSCQVFCSCEVKSNESGTL